MQKSGENSLPPLPNVDQAPASPAVSRPARLPQRPDAAGDLAAGPDLAVGGLACSHKPSQ